MEKGRWQKTLAAIAIATELAITTVNPAHAEDMNQTPTPTIAEKSQKGNGNIAELIVGGMGILGAMQLAIAIFRSRLESGKRRNRRR